MYGMEQVGLPEATMGEAFHNRESVARRRRRLARAFSMIELVLVIAIIGVLSSVVLPRLDGRSSAAAEAAVNADLSVVRSAIERYAAEHGNKYPGTSAARTIAQLTQYTDCAGHTVEKKTDVCLYGPYLQAIPPNPAWTKPGADQVYIDLVNSPPKAQLKAEAGWVYNPYTGEFYANSTGLKQHGGTLFENDAAVILAKDEPEITVDDLLAGGSK